jgi:hypothetical protein
MFRKLNCIALITGLIIMALTFLPACDGAGAKSGGGESAESEAGADKADGFSAGDSSDAGDAADESASSGALSSSAGVGAEDSAVPESGEELDTDFVGELDLKDSGGGADSDIGDISAGSLGMSGTAMRQPNLRPRLYRQYDEPWKNEPYGEGDPKDTVRRWACGPATMAMVVATLKDPSVDVSDSAKWSVEHGYVTTRPGRTEDEFFTAYAEKYGIKIERLYDGDLRGVPAEEAAKYHEKAYEAVKNGDWVIAYMGNGHWTSDAHFVLWYDIAGPDGDEVLIHDSNSERADKARNKLDYFRETVRRYWVIDVEKQDNR